MAAGQGTFDQYYNLLALEKRLRGILSSREHTALHRAVDEAWARFVAPEALTEPGGETKGIDNDQRS